MRLLLRAGDARLEDARGWFLHAGGDQASSAPLPDAQLPAALRTAALQCAGDGNGEFVATVDIDVTGATGRALDMVCDHIATDAAKGVGPFGVGGIAGPAST